jgi:hypothetical protein
LAKKKKRSVKFRSWYSGTPVTKRELLEVDRKLGRMKGEKREFLMDDLKKKFTKGKKKRKRSNPYTHQSKLGYKVLNISKKDINKVR